MRPRESATRQPAAAPRCAASSSNVGLPWNIACSELGLSHRVEGRMRPSERDWNTVCAERPRNLPMRAPAGRLDGDRNASRSNVAAYHSAAREPPGVPHRTRLR